MTDDTAENPLVKFPRDDCRVSGTAKRDTRSDPTRSEERKIESGELSLNGLDPTVVTRCHLNHGNANRLFMSRSNRPYGFTCSQISGVSAA
jgi:hypothetical protein